jgi:hypothetical protein
MKDDLRVAIVVLPALVSYFLSVRPLVSRSSTTSNQHWHKPQPRGGYTLILLSHFSFPFIRLACPPTRQEGIIHRSLINQIFLLFVSLSTRLHARPFRRVRWNCCPHDLGQSLALALSQSSAVDTHTLSLSLFLPLSFLSLLFLDDT